MPVIDSMARFAEQAAHYKTGCRDYENEVDADTAMEMVLAVSNFILSEEPETISRLAAGQASREILADSIIRAGEAQGLKSRFKHTDFLRRVENFLFGYGPLQPYITDDSISDIDGTGPDEFTVTRNGQRHSINLSFPDAKVFDTFCRLLIIRNGGVINENDSHCRVADPRYRLRINVTVPPRSARTTTISIRKHRMKTLELADLLTQGMLTEQNMRLVESLARNKTSVVFCGKGAAGKTTLLRAFIQALPKLERVLVAESDSEIYPEKPCCLVQKIKKKNEGGRPVDLRELISDGLTLSLDTYCIGEIVGDEAYEFMRAAFSGHRCLATVHAHSAADALDRIISLARPAASGESEKLMRKILALGVDYVIHLDAFKVDSILNIKGLDESGEGFVIKTIWEQQENSSADHAIDESALSLVSDT